MDETGISIVQTPNTNLWPKGQKQVESLTCWGRGANCDLHGHNRYWQFRASHAYFSPAKVSPPSEKGGPKGSIYRCPRNGWINEEIFMTWLEHFCKFLKPAGEELVLLIIDSNGFHKRLNVFIFCRDKWIIVLTIPPHTSHRLQPLGLTFFRPLKTAYIREAAYLWKRTDLKRKFPMMLICNQQRIHEGSSNQEESFWIFWPVFLQWTPSN
jgi:hypothetical protein